MSWNKTWIDTTARESARSDNALLEAIGLEQMSAVRVLDAGCFDGYNTYLKFAPYENIARVVGVDPETNAIDDARHHIDDERFEWCCSPFERYDGEPESFDVVYFSHALQHMEDKEQALQTAFRFLKPGGFIVIKTIDDSFNISSPDPDKLMERVYELYETKTRPHTQHTRHTDRRFGHKCPGLVALAGFGNIRMRVLLNESTGLDEQARIKLFERGTYFRSKVPAGAGKDARREMSALLTAWRELFTHDDYYFASATFLVVAQKPSEDGTWATYRGPLFESAHDGPAGAEIRTAKGACTLEPMSESDLGQVMAIEMKSFPDPWVPLAYALELRHNTCAHYMVLRDASQLVRGYLGWWENSGFATIAHVAVDPAARRSGFGNALMDAACTAARKAGCHTMQLQVRAENAPARAFYRAFGFTEVSVSKDYYTNPDDDAVIMVRTLEGKPQLSRADNVSASDADGI